MGLRVPITYASVTVQDLQYTENQLGMGLTITYKSGGTAGKERARINDKREIVVTMEDRVSTAAQIKASVENSQAANLVTIELLGEADAVQYATVALPFTSGAEANFGSVQLGPVLFTCLTAGSDADQNSIFIKYSNHTSVDVVYTTGGEGQKYFNVRFIDGISTNREVVAAVLADGNMSPLVKAKTVGGVFPMLVSAAPDFPAESQMGAHNAYAASAVIKNAVGDTDIIGLSEDDNFGSSQYTISLLGGGTAGSESVAVVKNDIQVTMEAEVSTAAQIVAALFTAETTASVDVEITDYTELSGKTFTVATTTVTEGVEWTASVDNTTTQISLCAALASVEEIDIDTADDGSFTVTAAEAGPAGNGIPVATNATAGITLSGDETAGGADAGFTVPGVRAYVMNAPDTTFISTYKAATSGGFSPSGTGFSMSSADRTIKADFFEYQFGFIPTYLKIKNTDTEGANILVVSFDGRILAASLAFGEEAVWSAGNIPHCVQLKYTEGAPAYTIEALAVGGTLLTEPTGTEAD